MGPESAGAVPGPLCYGDPSASELTLSDVNFALGRIQPDRFPFPLFREPVERGLRRVQTELETAGQPLSLEQIAAGFVRIANANMAQAIEQVSLARGQDPRDCALVGFGGAAGQHVCEVARELGVSTILLHPLAGVLSAYGIGISQPSWDGQKDAGRTLFDVEAGVPERVLATLSQLEAEGREALRFEAHTSEEMTVERRLDLRYVGTESPLPIREPRDGDYLAAFAAEHRARFGYVRTGRDIEIVTARVRLSHPIRSSATLAFPPSPDDGQLGDERTETVWFDGERVDGVPVMARESLAPGERLEGPAVLLEDTGTIVIAPGFCAELRSDGMLVLVDETGRSRHSEGDLGEVDPIRLEVLGNRFMAIAEQMGTVLRNTSVSTNIKERLDYSCAVFDGTGGLVANAPHIPVHLGAMSETVREVLERFPDLGEGDVVVTNDPAAGGSHLPDVTAVTPVFESGERPTFFVASRGHHSDIGGITPGSMPATSQTLDEEGVVLSPFPLVVAGDLREAELRARLTGAPHPARNPDDNLAELEAMLAANRCGVQALKGLAAEQGLEAIVVTMEQLQAAAASKVAREIGRIPDGVHHFEDALDEGTPVCVTFEIRGERMLVDFEGTGDAVPGNLNAPRAVVYAALIYVLRSLVSERIPLNGGCLAPVEVRIPPGSLLDPPTGAAVVGGNVETSQRVVDVLLGAMGRAAASQGTMNNVAFGDSSFGYYETIGGGVGGCDGYAGASGVHTHMTNTRITDPEILEVRHPVRLLEFALRHGSGGVGRFPGGNGLVRSYEFLAPVTVSLLTQRRTTAPFGLDGGGAGQPGRNSVRRRGGDFVALPSCATLELGPGDQLRIETPGGGGYGSAEVSNPSERSRGGRPEP
ncbi:hydantoinase B/oxoprolinase family protein [Myxococcota bacterium]|nr:hydantoinase B/oxoprolinase family protein [Myxococcota bacterium]